MSSSLGDKLVRAGSWFDSLSSSEKSLAFLTLIEIAIRSGELDVWSAEDSAKLAKEAGVPISHYQAPYFKACGEPVIPISDGSGA